MTASFWMSSSVRVWTAESFERSGEGKAVGFDLVVMAVDDVSMEEHQRLCKIMSCGTIADAIPLFSVPHPSHVKIAFSSPEDPSSRLPQSVQKTSGPIAAIV